MDSNTRVIIDVTLSSEEANQRAKDLGVSMKAIREEQKQLKASGKETDVAFQSNAVSLRQLQAEQKAYIAIANAAEGSNNQLSAQISLLTQQYNALGKEERDNTVAGKALQVQINGLSSELKVNKEAVGDHRMSVGDYEKANRSATDSIKQQTQDLSVLGGVVSQAPIGFQVLGQQVGKVTDIFKNSLDVYRSSTAAQKENVAIQKIATEAKGAEGLAMEKVTSIGFKLTAVQTQSTLALKASEAATRTSIQAGESFVAGELSLVEAEAAKTAAIEAARVAAVAEAEAEKVRLTYTEAQTVATNTSIVSTAAQTAATESQTVATAAGTAATKAFRLALASTGIGAIIVLVAALVNYMSKFKPLTDAVEQGISAVSAAFEVLGGYVFSLVKPLEQMWDNPKKALIDFGNFLLQNIINRFRSFGVIIDAIRTGNLRQLSDGFIQMGTGITGATDKITKGIGGFSKNISQAAIDAAKLTKKTQDLDDAERESVSTLSKLRLERDKYAVQAKNTSLSESERIKLLDKSSKKEKEAFIIEDGLAKKRLGIIKEQMAIEAKRNNGREATDEQQAALYNAEAKVNDLAATSLKFTEKRYNDQAKLQEKAAADATKSAEKNADADNVRLESLLKTNESILTARQKEMAAVNQEIDEKVAKYKKYAATTEQLEKERTARLLQIADQFHKEDLAQIDANNKVIQDIAVSGIKNEGDRRLAQLQLNQSRELEALAKDRQLVQDRVNKGETGLNDLLQSFDDKKTAILAEGTVARQDLVKSNYETELDAFNKQQVNLANAQVANAGTDGQKLEAKQMLLDAQYQMDMDHANLVGQDTTLIVAQYEQQKRQAQLDTIDTVESGFKNFSSSFQSLVSENSTAYKVAGAIQARVDAAQALRNNILIIQENIKAIASQGKLPFPLNIVAIVSTLAALGGAVLAAKNLVSPIKLATGGIFQSDGRGTILSGPGSGTSDSINARLSNGEAVINARSTRMFQPMLSAINMAGGGAPLVPGHAMALGGIANGGYISDLSRNVSNDIDLRELVVAIRSMPAPIVDVRQIVSAQQKLQAAKVRGDI